MKMVPFDHISKHEDLGTLGGWAHQQPPASNPLYIFFSVGSKRLACNLGVVTTGWEMREWFGLREWGVECGG